MTSEHILIVQDLHVGHRLSYIRHIVEYCREANFAFSLVMRSAAKNSDEWNLHLEDLVTADQVHWARKIDLAVVKQAAVGRKASRIVIPDGDAWLFLMLSSEGRRLAKQVPISLLVMRPSGQSTRGILRVASTLAKSLVRRAVRFLAAVSVWTLVSSTQLRVGRHEVQDPVSFTPKCGEDVGEFLASLDDSVYWFAVLGAINERKNVPLILSALLSMESPRRIGLLMAGKISEDVLADLKIKRDSIRAVGVAIAMRDELLPDVDFDSILAAVDCVVLAHANEGPSGILGKADLAGVRVVAAGARSLRKDIRKAPSLGEWVPLNSQELAFAFERATVLGRPSKEVSPRKDKLFAYSLVEG